MVKVILYEHGCPRCKVVKSKLDQKGIQYETVNDVNIMQAKGFVDAPKLDVDGVIMDFKDAIKWIGEQ
jgi:glutaredoxin